MKKYNILLLFFLAVLFASCNKDINDNLSSNLSDNASYLRSSAQPMQISYELRTLSKITPDNGNFEDMCVGDIRMLQNMSKWYQVNTRIDAYGNPCINVVQKSEVLSDYRNLEGNNPAQVNYHDEATTSFCNGVMTHTTQDTTITENVSVNETVWISAVQAYLMSDVEIKQAFVQLLDTLQQQGAAIVHEQHSVTITENLPNGEQLISVYSKESMLLYQIQHLDAAGNIIKTFLYDYACTDDGKVVPKSILITSKNNSPVCDQPFTKQKWLIFDNYNINFNA